jgi:trimeric autotransporter adhesin
LRFSSVAGADPNGVPVPIASVDGSITVQPTSSGIVRLQPNGVLNGASFLSGPVAPGEIVTLIGSGIGPVSAQEPTASPSSTTLADSEVLFDGIRAPLLFAAQNQINAVVPYGTYGKTKTQVEVTLQGQRIAGTQVSVAPTAPAIFTFDSSGAGQGAILNQDSTMNSPANPASKGSVVALYGTGAGQTDPGGSDGQIAGAVLPKPLLQVYATMGEVAAEVQYAGAAPGLIAGVIQVNILIPAEAPSGEAVPITLTIGQRDSGTGVTLAIK